MLTALPSRYISLCYITVTKNLDVVVHTHYDGMEFTFADLAAYAPIVYTLLHNPVVTRLLTNCAPEALSCLQYFRHKDVKGSSADHVPANIREPTAAAAQRAMAAFPGVKMDEANALGNAFVSTALTDLLGRVGLQKLVFATVEE